MPPSSAVSSSPPSPKASQAATITTGTSRKHLRPGLEAAADAAGQPGASRAARPGCAAVIDERHHEDARARSARRSARARGRPGSPSTTLGSAAMISTTGFTYPFTRGVHELAHIEGGEQRDRYREDHRVEGALERAVDQRRQAELRLEVVGAARGLPDVRGLRVALVPDLAEQGSRGSPPDAGCRASTGANRPPGRRRRARRPWARARASGPAGRPRRGARSASHLTCRSGPSRRRRRPPSRTPCRASRRLKPIDRLRVALELVDLRETHRPAGGRRDHLPGRDAAGLVAHHQRAVADQEAERGHRRPALEVTVDRLHHARRRRVPGGRIEPPGRADVPTNRSSPRPSSAMAVTSPSETDQRLERLLAARARRSAPSSRRPSGGRGRAVRPARL